MRFSLQGNLLKPTISEEFKRAEAAEKLGFEGLFFPSGLSISIDTFLLVAACAMRTKRIRLGSGVTNMVTRHPAVLAGSAAGLNEISNGRAILGIGTGDNAVYRLGLTASPVAKFEEDLRNIRELVQGRSITVPRGNKEIGPDFRFSLRAGKLPVPIYVAAEGPRTLRVAGKLADGIILGTGFDLRVLHWARERIAEGAKEAGRSLSDIDIAVAGMICVDEDGALARNLIRARLSNRAHHNFRFTLETVPPEELDGVRRFMEAFDLSKSLEQEVDPELVNDYLLERFAIAGTPEECIARVRKLEEAGVDHIMVTPHMKGYFKVMEVWAKKVMPHFQNI